MFRGQDLYIPQRFFLLGVTMTKRHSLVIVEDEKPIAKAEEIILKEIYDVHLAHDGEAGWSKILEVRPDLVVLDVMMPKMNGFELCRRIRDDDRLATTKIVMVTAKNQEKDELKGMGLGADDYIMKPFEPVELLHVVRQVLKE